MKRICIYAKDIQQITGKSERQSRNIIMKIRELHNKQKHQAITVDEFCSYMGINPASVLQVLK
ncbi:hypothetical protein [Flavobacterium terrae]|uniref:Uncharacterized protein n=1 Tax=Flavobacterium terrae TaxID=415425 RepID=A0A1M6CUY0_9FLAO|nr:hypothetical protein [Flavobacterium terrae]SHI64796.1 hypothetical protein SAMN05444363_1109 [Flavobacterium terrae]